MAPLEGLEPPTYRVEAGCSKSAELQWYILIYTKVAVLSIILTPELKKSNKLVDPQRVELCPTGYEPVAITTLA